MRMPIHQRYCCICQNHGKKIIDGRKVSLHRFPSDSARKRIWIQRCKNARSNFIFKNHDQTRLCSAHFEGGAGPTDATSIPTVFPKPDGSNKIYKIKNMGETSQTSQDNLEVHVDITDEDSVICNDTCSLSLSNELDSQPSLLDVSLHFHDYGGAGSVPKSTFYRHQNVQTQPDARSVLTQTELSVKSIEDLNKPIQVEKFDIGNCDMNIQAQRPCLTFDDVAGIDSKVMFYTGIPDSNTFTALFDELKCGTIKQSDNGRPRILRLVDEFFLVLMRLRLGLLLEDLADRFHIGVSTCSSIFNRWIDYLDVQLQFLIQWPSREIINNTMPKNFKRKYPKCRVVVDCTEIKTETPSSLQLKSLMYSDYKAHMTYKSLIGISPNGVVTFVSDLYCGSVSDKQITKLSGLVDLCEEGDAIMADKGFLISDLTTPKGVDLIIPPFKQNKKQLSKREVTSTRDIANLRIHVEREMERIKNFRILQGIMPITMASQSSKIWKICVRLTNLQPPLVLD